ncbi:DUF6541 family protein [Paramicrobacterium agarici]|uniref:DUF6541 family protein n=1 Tax=Paramicrobacterium agarici TaxID=630514 RepID=UPI001151D664|nr:DUF6541 family protein [Microbacterium agarici]TQO21791.1 hypothetical protein FB385_0603 [Microbacterium agarici]
MTWVDAIPVILIALLIIFVPGGLIAAAAGARRTLLALAAPAVTIALLAIGAIAFGKIGVPWSVGPLAGLFCGIALITWVVRRLVLGTWAASSDSRIVGFSRSFALGLGIAAVIIVLQLGFSFGAPDNVSQTYDAPFHLNGVQYIIETANGSSLHLTGLILPPGRSTFYPAAWHDLVSVVAMAAPWAELVGVANMTNLVLASIVWPLGVLTVVRLMLPARRSALLIAGVLSAAFPPFPLGMLDYGVLFSYFLALALLPGGLALGLSLFRLVNGKRLGAVTLQVLSLGCVVVAMGLAQPSVVFGLGLFGVIGLVAVCLNKIRESRTNGRRVMWVIGILTLLIAYALVWRRVGSFGYNAPWREYALYPEVILDTFTFAREDRPLAIVIALLTIIGIVAAIRRGSWWLTLMWLAAAGLFALAGATPPGDLRNMALGMFYKDTPRLEAFLVLPALVLAVYGADAVWRAVERRWPSLKPGATATVGAVGLVALVATTQLTAMIYAVQHASNSYRLDDRSWILDDEERALIERLPGEVPKDAVIVGNPWTGTSWAMALSQRKVLNPHFNTSHAKANEIVNTQLNEAGDETGVCDAIRSTDVRYVLDFGMDRLDGRRLDVKTWIGFEGLLDLDESDIVEEVDREGDKVLYRITACGL